MPNIVAATTAIIDPLPVLNSDERYSPMKTDVRPKNCVHMRHDRKLFPMICAVAAGVTRSAVTNRVPTIWTMLTTTAAVVTLKNSPIALVGIP